jgi:hypothetical protein
MDIEGGSIMATARLLRCRISRLATCFLLLLLFAPSCLGTSAILLPTPKWQIGEWFEIKVSHWKGFAVAMPSAEVKWGKPEIIRYKITGESVILGFPCFIVEDTRRLYGQNYRYRYLFRKSDLSLLDVQTAEVSDSKKSHSPKWEDAYGASPRAVMNLGFVPSFPVAGGSQSVPVRKRPEYEKRWEPDNQNVQNATSIQLRLGKTTHQAVQIDSVGYVCRWVPGQIWWAQCWQQSTRAPGSEGRNGKKVAFYRAALYATSRDGRLDYPLPKAATGGIILEGR